MSVFKNNWKKSLAGVAILSFIGSSNSFADDAKKDDGKEKIVVLELKEAKPAQVHKREKKDVEIIELAGKKVHEHDVEIIDFTGGKIHEGDQERVVLELRGDGKHEVIELSGTPGEVKKKMAIYLKKMAAELSKAAKTGDEKKVMVLKKKLVALKKVLSQIHLEGAQGKVRIVVTGDDKNQVRKIRQRIVIADRKIKGTLPAGVRVIRADQLEKVKLKLLLEKAAISDAKLETKKMIELYIENQKPAQLRTRRSGSSSRSEFSKLFSRAGRPQASRKLEGELAKIHEKISHLKKAAESLKAAGFKKKAKELLVTVEKLAAEAKERAAKVYLQRAEKERIIANDRRREAEALVQARQAESEELTAQRRVLVESRRRAIEGRVGIRSRSNRGGIARERRSAASDVNAELIQVIHQLRKEMKELRKDVNNLKKKVNK